MVEAQSCGLFQTPQSNRDEAVQMSSPRMQEVQNTSYVIHSIHHKREWGVCAQINSAKECSLERGSKKSFSVWPPASSKVNPSHCHLRVWHAAQGLEYECHPSRPAEAQFHLEKRCQCPSRPVSGHAVTVHRHNNNNIPVLAVLPLIPFCSWLLREDHSLIWFTALLWDSGLQREEIEELLQEGRERERGELSLTLSRRQRKITYTFFSLSAV